MPAEKRNHFLDVDESEDDESQGYDSEAEQARKGSSKRRKLDLDPESDEGEDEIDDESQSDDEEQKDAENKEHEKKIDGDKEKSSSKDKSTPKDTSDITAIAKPLTKKNLVATEKSVKRSGVVYISRIPPFSKSLLARKHCPKLSDKMV